MIEERVKEIVTSFRINENLWKEARIYAIENGMSMKDLIENVLKTELKENRIQKKTGGEK